MQTLSSLIVTKIATHTLCVILLHSWLTWMHNNQPFFFLLQNLDLKVVELG